MYPDVSVACRPIQHHRGATDIVTNPVLVVEVLSPSTANHDRGSKFELYRQFPTLREYQLLHQKSIFAEHFSKSPDGSWVLREYRGEDATIAIPSIQCELHLGSIYEDVMDEPE